MLFHVVVVADMQEHEDVSVCAGSDPDEVAAPASVRSGKASTYGMLMLSTQLISMLPTPTTTENGPKVDLNCS